MRNPWVKSFSCIKMTSTGTIEGTAGDCQVLSWINSWQCERTGGVCAIIKYNNEDFCDPSHCAGKNSPCQSVSDHFLPWNGKKTVPPFYHFWLPTETFDGPSCLQRQNWQLEYGRSCKRICWTEWFLVSNIWHLWEKGWSAKATHKTSSHWNTF